MAITHHNQLLLVSTDTIGFIGFTGVTTVDDIGVGVAVILQFNSAWNWALVIFVGTLCIIWFTLEQTWVWLQLDPVNVEGTKKAWGLAHEVYQQDGL